MKFNHVAALALAAVSFSLFFAALGTQFTKGGIDQVITTLAAASCITMVGAGAMFALWNPIVEGISNFIDDHFKPRSVFERRDSRFTRFATFDR